MHPISHSRHYPCSLHVDSCPSSFTLWPSVPMLYEAQQLHVAFLFKWFFGCVVVLQLIILSLCPSLITLWKLFENLLQNLMVN